MYCLFPAGATGSCVARFSWLVSGKFGVPCSGAVLSFLRAKRSSVRGYLQPKPSPTGTISKFSFFKLRRASLNKRLALTELSLAKGFPLARTLTTSPSGVLAKAAEPTLNVSGLPDLSSANIISFCSIRSGWPAASRTKRSAVSCASSSAVRSGKGIVPDLSGKPRGAFLFSVSALSAKAWRWRCWRTSISSASIV